jgi:hypothetical protein
MSTPMIIILFILGWIACGLLSYCFILTYMQTVHWRVAEVKFREHRSFALRASYFGYFGLLSTLVCGYQKKGIKLSCLGRRPL